MNGEVVVSDYNQLRNQVAQLLQDGKGRAVRAVEQERSETYQGIGRLLHDYLLGHRERAEYGDQTVVKLAQDVGLSKSLLYQILAFHRLNPIFHTRGKLGWSHYRALLSLPTSEEQRFYEEAASQNGWSVRELEAQVKAGAFAQAQSQEEGEQSLSDEKRILPALRGQLYTYRVVTGLEASDLRLDLGFGIHLSWLLTGVEQGGLLQVQKNESGGFEFLAVGGRRAAYYSYTARVVDVMDGNTLWLDIDCGFRVWTRQKVRLRGVDTPELGTAEGRRAKDFVTTALRDVSFVAVTTTKPDTYDRYLADVFFLSDAETTEAVFQEGTFLNRALLKAGLATRFSG